MTLPNLSRIAAAATPGPWETGRPHPAVVKNPDDLDWVATVQASNRPNWRENAARRLLRRCETFLDAAGSHDALLADIWVILGRPS